MRATLECSWLTRRPSNRALTITSLGAGQRGELGVDPASHLSSSPMTIGRPNATAGTTTH
jgi:hypothetical protein